MPNQLTLYEQAILLVLNQLVDKQVTASTLDLAAEFKSFIESSNKCTLEYYLDSLYLQNQLSIQFDQPDAQ
jgi:hypothetical protein